MAEKLSPSNSWEELLQIAQTNKSEYTSNKWFKFSPTAGSGSGRCKITNVGYYLGMSNRSKHLKFTGSDVINREVKQEYKPFWAALKQTIGASKGDESRA